MAPHYLFFVHSWVSEACAQYLRRVQHSGGAGALHNTCVVSIESFTKLSRASPVALSSYVSYFALCWRRKSAKPPSFFPS